MAWLKQRYHLAENILILLGFFTCFTFGYPEIGFLGKLESDVSRTSTGWQKISNWKTSITDVKGLYNFDASLAASGDISIPVTGLFFVSVSLPVSNADIGAFKAALLINDITMDKSIALSCQMENMTDGTQMLSFAGFLSLRADEQVAVYAYSSNDTAWIIKSQSGFSFHFFGRFGSTPGFLVQPMTSWTITNPNNTRITTWRTTGRGGLFQSLTGFTKSNGKFTTICTGVYILTANIIFEGPVGDYSVSTVFNEKSSIVGSVHMGKAGVVTVNVYQAFSLPKGTTVDIDFTSNAGQIKVLQQSSWSMVFLGSTSSNTQEFASFLTSTVEFTGGQWLELPGLLRDSATQTAMGTSSGQLIMPSNLALIDTKNFVITDQTELYYVFAHLVYSGNATNVEALLGVSADKTTLTGKEGVYGSMTKISNQDGTMSLSGILHIRKQEHFSIFIKTSNPNDRFTVRNTSFISVVRMRYIVSAFSARIETKITYQKSGWNEIKGPWLIETSGLFSYGKDFSSTTGRFTASHTGVYLVSANIQINKGDGAVIALVLAKNGLVDPGNGLYSENGEPSAKTTLNMYGTLSVKTGDQLSLFAYKSNALDWEVDLRSGFSITYVGPNWAIHGFHAVYANDTTISTLGYVEMTDWTLASPYTTMTFYNNIGFSSTRYTSSYDGVYFVAANVLLRNVSIPSAAYGAGLFEILAYVNGRQTTSIGLEDSNPSFADNSRDYFTLNFGGVVRIQKGEYLSLFLRSTADASYTISRQSGFSVALVSMYSHAHNQGLLGSNNVISYVASPNVWVGIADLSTSSTIPGRFIAGTGAIHAPTFYYRVDEPGIYLISGNFRLDAAGGSLFEIQAEIDSQSSKVYGLYAVETSPKGTKYSLSFAGSLYLTFGQQLKIMVRSSKSTYAIDAGSSFSIIKLQLDKHFPGVVVDKHDASFAANQMVSNWEESTKPGLLTSNIGYKAVAGTYSPPVAGIYIVSINNYLSTAADATSIALIDSANSNVIKAYGLNGNNRTMMSASALYLESNKTFSYQLNSTVPESYAMEAGLSLYFIKPRALIQGFSTRLLAEFVIQSADTWTTVSNWTNSSLTGFSSGAIAPMDSYTAVYSGAHFISFSAVTTHSTSFNIKVAVLVNSSIAMMASLDNIPASNSPNRKSTLPVSGTLKLSIGDVVEFKVYSSSANATLTTETSRSLIFIEGVTVHTEGVAGQKSSNEIVTRAKTSPKQLSNFETTRPGAFSARNGTLTSTGSLVNFHPGVFLLTANVMILNTASSTRKFRLYSVLNSETESSFTLQSIQTIDANKEATLSLSSSIFLPRFSHVETFITTDDDNAFQILANSTFTFILIDDNTGPVICEDTGLNLERIVPSFLRIMTEKSVTFSCTVVGTIPATLSWYKDGNLIAGQTATTYTMNPTLVSNSGVYSCKATYQSLTATTNNATLSVYDPTPKISAPVYNISFAENIAPGSFNLQTFAVSAEKYAINIPAIVSALITAGDPNGDFNLTLPSTTMISIQPTRELDYERTPFYSLSITAVNTEEADARNTTIIFNITVIDKNDNAPTFSSDVIKTVVPEDLSVGSIVYKVTATDKDSGEFGVVTYSIVGNLTHPYFSINSTTGAITLDSALDREREDGYVIIVRARDSIFSSVAAVVVNVTDVNDNQPRFNPASYSFSVVENILVDSSIVQVFSSDPDLGLNSSMVYSILSGNENGYFRIDSSNGIISLVKSLDYEARKGFTLIIGLKDRGTPVLQSSNNATVNITVVDVNDNFPQFPKSLYITSIPEDTSVTSSIVQVNATDRDGTMKNSNITYSINQTLASTYFHIDSHTGIITVKSALDYETHRRYDFAVIASDTGDVPYTRHTNVIVLITDVNDERPYFQPAVYIANVSEFAIPGALVVQLHGFDNDTTSLQYQITSQTPKEDFLISSTSGTLYVKNYLDRENITSYNITISLSDGVNLASQLATISLNIIDENDNRPTFLQSIYRSSLFENATIGTYVTTVRATDLDTGSNAALTYSILSTGLNDSYSYFNINSTTGVVTLAKQVDYETMSKLSFFVLATDAGRIRLHGHSVVEVTVMNINDNAPYFMPDFYAESISEAANVGAVVAVLKAYDNDSSTANLMYEIIEGNTNNHFKLMSSTSNVIITAAELDYESIKTYELKIRAFDGQHYSITNATVKITVTDINDVNPVFNQTLYTATIPEDTGSSIVILTVLATDNDHTANNSRIRYSALENTTDFNVNAMTGEIRVNSIDYEKQKQYSLVVVAQDYGTPPRMAYALVDITITDVNDNFPVFSPLTYQVNISEATIVNTQIVIVMATDADAGTNGQLQYSIVGGNEAAKFAIQPNTGVITLAAMLDYESSVKSYNLTISVADKGGKTAVHNSTVLINIVDVNDHQPMFDLSSYVKTIIETTQNGSSILRVHASDNDGTFINSNVLYSIVPSIDSGNFSINSTSGVIYTADLFDRELNDYYSFQVEAQDTANATLRGRCMVTVHISDYNDNTPVPDMIFYSLNISRKASVGTQVITIFATDKDMGVNSQLQYSITNGNIGNTFTINNKGVIYLAMPLNTAVQSQYNLTVKIQDNGVPSLHAIVTVQINITDVQLSLLQFKQVHYIFYVNETTSTSYVGAIKAVDIGNITSEYINYQVIATNLDGIIFLHSSSGDIYLNVTANHEARKQYDFTAKAMNNIGTTAFAHVTIYVRDINESPYFLQTTNGVYYFNVSESVAQYTFVHSVIARDNDTGANGQLVYSLILTPANQNTFLIDQHGRIYTKSSLDYETTKQYNFTVQVADGGSPSLTANAVVIIKVLDYNDNHPVFVYPTPRNISVLENTASGTKVGMLNATDADSKENAMIQYVGVYPSGFVNVNESTGELTIGDMANIDYEKTQTIELIAVVKDLGTPHLTTTTMINFFIENVNDNDPYFATSFYNLTISEVTQVGSLIIPLHALDNDLGVPGTIKTYDIISSNFSKFSINNLGELRLAAQLSHSVQSTYHLVINVTDNGTPARYGQANVYINVADLSRLQPTFLSSTYYKTVAENNAVNESLLQVNATTNEAIFGPMVYSIVSSSNDSKYFTIDSTAGVIRNLISFDYEKQRSFAFTVQVLDSHNQKTGISHVIIYVLDLNDNTPVFVNTKMTYNISEATSVGSLVISLLAADNDSTTNGRFIFSAVDGNGMDKLTVEPDGRIYLKNNVDSRVRNNYTLTVKVEDLGNPSLHSNITLTIYIQPASLVHLSQPVFNQSSYIRWVDEDITVTSLLVVNATNRGITSMLTYSLVGDSSETSPFSISSAGVISLTVKLDYITKRMYTFQVKVTNSEGRVAYAHVMIHVRDVNDRSPYFMPSFYSVNIIESTMIGQPIVQLHTKDNDTTAFNAQYAFTIVRGNEADRFNVSNTGLISLKNSLDLESMSGTSSYTLVVSVKEGSNPKLSNATVVINIYDYNDVTPVFNQSVYVFNVSEDARLLSSVGIIFASDRDRTQSNNRVTYTLATTGTDFALSADGNLTVNNKLNYAIIREYELVAIAQDNGFPPLKSSTIIKINVIDVNDQYPTFKQLYYSNNVSEALPIGAVVVRVMANDNDSMTYGLAYYNLTDPTSTFTIDSSGRISLLKKLDYEITQNYTLIVDAVDAGGLVSRQSATVFIRITDVNDYQPTFTLSYYTFYVAEDLANGSLIGNVHTSDGDRIRNAISYSLVPNEDSGNFTVLNNGSIIMSTGLDYEAIKRYSFLVQATDQGNPSLNSRAHITIFIQDVNDNYPTASQGMYSLNISERTLVGNQIFTIPATDLDSGENSRLTFTKLSGDSQNDFFINNKGQIYVLKALDSFSKPFYNMTIRISDNGSPQKSTNVIMIIGVLPTSLDAIRCQVPHYTFNVTENVIATPFGPIKAVDTGNYTSTRIVYDVFTNQVDINKIFYLDRSTGMIYMNQTANYELRSQYDFQAKAVNERGVSTYCHVTIKVTDVNEKAIFTNTINGAYYFNVSESVPIKSFVGYVSIQDVDRSSSLNPYTFSLGPSWINSLLTIDGKGHIYTKAILDYETNKTIVFNVNVTDSTLTSVVKVHLVIIDYNDNHPVFVFPTPSSLNVKENITVGTVLGKLNATDADSTSNGQVIFIGIYPTGIVKVNQTTGLLTVDNITNFDYERFQSYELLAIAQDLGSPSLQTTHRIHLNIENVNDNSPYFNVLYYNLTISEAAQTGTIVIPLKANDDDLGIPGNIAEYKIIAGNDANHFTINKITGVLSLKSKLNYNVKSFYSLTVQAVDGGWPARYATVTINIQVLDFSEVQPQFTLNTYYVSVFENTTIQSEILQVNATTQASSSGTLIYSIRPNNYSTAFIIDNTTGLIRNRLQFDFERQKFYTFVLLARDSVSQRVGQTHVIVSVKDINDNSPVFINTNLVHNISEATSVGSTVLTVTAKDADSTTNGQIVYRASGGDGMTEFTVEPDGKVILSSHLDSKIKQNYTLIITASDLGNPTLETNITVTINVLPASLIHLSLPIFNQTMYTVWVDEGILIHSFLKVNASNQAVTNAPIAYSIQGTAMETSPFNISSTTGYLNVITPLNYEMKKVYTFNVIATNIHGRSATTSVTVYVRDKNDNRPYFSPMVYTSHISECFQPSDFVAQLFIKDNDTTISNGPHNYVITSGNNPPRFNVSSTGMVSVAQMIDYESLSSSTITLTVTVAEASHASISVATVNIVIRDENDNHPRFNRSTIYLSINENEPAGNVIYTLNATDADKTNSNNQITYSLLPSNGKFAINSNGQLTIASTLNYEERKDYELTVVATDNGTPSLSGYAVIFINVTNVNDNPPMFKEQCSNTISESHPIGSTVVICQAIDADVNSTLTYKINNSNVFTVNNKGEITLVKQLDSRIQQSYNLTLIVSDGNFSTVTTVTVNVLPVVNCRPLFNQSLYIAYVREDVHQLKTVLTVFANDSRNSSLSYSLQSGVTTFTVNSQGVIKTAKLLDYNVKNMYIFKVYANGGSSVAESVVIIYVIDINNKLPLPGQISYSVEVSEKAAIGAIVIGVNASDPDTNSKFTYSISSGNVLDSFRVDSNGRIRVKKSLDYELLPLYNLQVSISDGIHTTTVPVTVKVLDVYEPTTCSPCQQCPHVSTFDFMKSAYKTVAISDSTAAGTVLTTISLNTAAQNRLISANYSIEDATAQMYFSVNNSGHVTLKNALDAATLISLKKYTFTVYNQFKCRKAATEIIIDSALSGCLLQFTKNHYEATVYENHPLHQSLLKIQTKPFSSSAIYSIVEASAKTLFSIDQSTGDVSLISSLNYETKQQHQFTVSANVSNLISYTSVIINVKDVNDNCPQLGSATEVLYQPVQAGTICGYVSMNDSDTFNNHTFAITNGDVNNNFTIDNKGILRARTQITTTTKTIYNLAIAVSDGVCTSSSSIKVVVNKDVPPPCPTPPSCYNYTCAPCATTQPATQCPQQFCPGCPVCPTTSAPCPTTQMTTACPVQTCPSCPTTCPATVTCPVCPTLHCPSCPTYTAYKFKKSYYTVSVLENSTAPSHLLTTQINGALVTTYSIVNDSTAYNMFDIDPNTGKISLKSKLNYTAQSSYRFTVRATIGSEYSETTVVVNVIDVNNNCPVFSVSQTYTRLTSPVESGTIIAWNKATDVDTKSTLTYQIVAGDSASEFTIDNMGVIRSQKRIVIAGSKTFNLTIRASDGVCAVDSHSVIIIHLDTMFTVTPSKCPVYCPVCPICTTAPSNTVTNCQNVTIVNGTTCPTCPTQCTTCVRPSGYMFATTRYTLYISENTTYSNAILTVQLGGNVAANFSIIEADALTNFKVNKTTGQLWLIRKLDYEELTKHNFTIKASFGDGIESRVAVDVYVININDNNPQFIKTSYLTTLHEYTIAGAHVAQVVGSDVDDKLSVRYSIASGNGNSLFKIDQKTGIITLLQSPYLFTQNIYHLRIDLKDTGNNVATTQALVTVMIQRLTSAKAGCSIYGTDTFVTKAFAENVTIGTVIMSAASRHISSARNIKYEISNPEALALFNINATTGEITTKSRLDYEKKTSHLIVVKSFDPVTNLTTTSVVYVNVTNIDEHPLTFASAPTQATVSEMASVSAYVAQVKATDADKNTVISYSITSGNQAGTFTIDPVTGVIRLNKTLDFSTKSSYLLKICATSSTGFACHNFTAMIKNENNHNTIFSQSSYTSSVRTNSTVGAIVTTVSASDPDKLGPLTYSIDGAVANEYFQINSSGIVTLKKSLSSASLPSPYVLKVCAKDNGTPSTTQCVPVIVNLGTMATTTVQPNNFDPFFLFSSYHAVVDQRIPVGSVIMKIIANDNDTGLPGLVHYDQLTGINSTYFKVNELTGAVTLLKSLNTSDTPKVFFLTLSIRDHGTPVRYSRNSANVSIAVQKPSHVNNSIVSVSSLTMDVILSKDPFQDSKIIKYEIVAQEYSPTSSNYNDLTALYPVSWYYVHFIPSIYQYRRFVIATVYPQKTARRKRRDVLENTQPTYLKYRAGTEQGCQLKTLETSICNGPLMPGKSYRYQLVGYYAENNPVTGAFTSPMPASLASLAAATGVLNSSYIATYWIIGLVVLALMFFIAVLVIVVILCYKKRYRVYIHDARTFANPIYGEEEPPTKPDLGKDNLNFYASDTVDGYSSIDTLKNKAPHQQVESEEFEMTSHEPIGIGLLGPQHSFQNYETVSNQVTFEEENPEWASMDISLKIDPSGKSDPVITTREERQSDSSTRKDGSESSDSSSVERKTSPPPSYDDFEQDEVIRTEGVRISVDQDDDDEDTVVPAGVTKL
eukprot:gene15994-17605_t